MMCTPTHLLSFLLGAIPIVLAYASLDAQNAPAVRQGRRWTTGQPIKTSSGLVKGHGAANISDVSEYLGIPFAQPPVGKLRFQPPVKYIGSDAVINGSSFVSLPTPLPLSFT